jgi:2-amino-4-hydroxy-6-hydroxymethyldihydropteridine diphosphokinase
MTEKKTTYLGLGTNTGNRKENLTRAIEELSLALGSCIAKSSFMETEPWGFESENRFLNCVVAFTTDKDPIELLDTTEEIERRLGRTQKSSDGVYHDRIIDIDILLYGSETISTERLTIPHPLMHKRDFVLEPLTEIAPDVIHPIIGKSINDLLQELKNEE